MVESINMRTTTFYLYKGSENLIAGYPVFTLLFAGAGLGVSQISWLLAIWSLPVVLLEIPSGVLADRWSRRNLLGIAGVLKALCFFLWMVEPSFAFFALGFLCWGTAEALSSGAWEALLYDSLLKEGQQESFSAVYGRASSIAAGAVALSCFSGGFLAQRLGYPPVLLLSITAVLSSTLIVMSLPEVNPYRAKRTQNLKTVTDALRLLVSHRSLLMTVLLLVIPISTAGLLDEYDPLVASGFGLAPSLVGLWVGGRYLLEAVGALAAGHLRYQSQKLSLLLCAGSGLSLLVYSLFSTVGFLAFYFLFYLLLSAAGVIQESLLQKRIEDQGRSTVHSIISLATDLHAILLYAILGLLPTLASLLACVACYVLLMTLAIRVSSGRSRNHT